MREVKGSIHSRNTPKIVCITFILGHTSLQEELVALSGISDCVPSVPSVMSSDNVALTVYKVEPSW